MQPEAIVSHAFGSEGELSIAEFSWRLELLHPADQAIEVIAAFAEGLPDLYAAGLEERALNAERFMAEWADFLEAN